MKVDDQRVAIARLHLGIEPVYRMHIPDGDKMGVGENFDWFTGPFNTGSVCIPDYTNDLNAMHTVEKTILKSFQDRWVYLGKLNDIVSPQVNGREPTTWPWAYVMATAAQRAEAFLKARGKWVS